MLLGEQRPNGDWQWYIRDPDTDEPLLTLINGVPYFYELDHRMMPVRLWDAEGKRVWQANADTWGRCQPDIPEGPIHQPIRLPGQFEDELSGLYNNRFRDYGPSTGRYLTPDPLGLKGGLNSYRYTPNPIDYVDPLGLNTCSARSPGPEEAGNGDMAPVTEDSPALQNLEMAGAAALARAPAPTPTAPGVTRVGVGTAANDAVYASQRSWLGRALPIASTATAFVTGMAYSSSLGGKLETITAPDGTVYSKHGDERIWNATGPGDAQWQTDFPQEDMEYRTWLAHGGDGSFEEWLASGKPKDVMAGGGPVPDNKLIAQLDRLRSEGHVLERHGGAVTDEQLYVRARTGVAPDGSKTRRGYTPTSTAFNSDELLVQADDFLRNNYLDDAIKNAEPGTLRIKVSADTGVELARISHEGIKESG